MEINQCFMNTINKEEVARSAPGLAKQPSPLLAGKRGMPGLKSPKPAQLGDLCWTSNAGKSERSNCQAAVVLR
jgi:hypothetical protein